MHPGGLDADEQLVGDLPVRPAQRELLENLSLARREAEGVVGLGATGLGDRNSIRARRASASISPASGLAPRARAIAWASRNTELAAARPALPASSVSACCQRA